MNPKPATVTLYEIAIAANVSEDTVRRRRAEWGLNDCRSAASKSPAIFFREEASRILLSKKIIIKPL